MLRTIDRHILINDFQNYSISFGWYVSFVFFHFKRIGILSSRFFCYPPSIMHTRNVQSVSICIFDTKQSLDRFLDLLNRKYSDKYSILIDTFKIAFVICADMFLHNIIIWIHGMNFTKQISEYRQKLTSLFENTLSIDVHKSHEASIINYIILIASRRWFVHLWFFFFLRWIIRKLFLAH